MKYNARKPPYIQIRLFTAKKNEAMKKVAYINNTSSKIKEMSQILKVFMFVEKCKIQKIVIFMFFVL